MAQNVNAEIIAIGTEILLGEITDTNSVFIARVLRDIGVNVYYMTSVGDNERRIADAIQIALGRAQVVITCGGLGPTVDDMTRSAVALATDRGLTFHQALLDKIAVRFAGFRAQMTENNRRQAHLPDNAIVIENPVGTAPSFIVEHEGGVVISLPGVPREMKFLITESVVPYLRERYDLHGHIIKARILRTAGIGESALDEMIGADILQGVNPTVGLAAHSGQVDVRITAKADTADEADAMIAEMETRVRQRVGASIFGVDTDTIEKALVDSLRDAGFRVAVSETGLEGAVSQQILSMGGDVVAATEAMAHPDDLREHLDADSDATLRELAELAAKAIAVSTSSEIGIAVVSRPDVTDDHADTEVGSAIAVYAFGEIRSRSYGFGGNSDTAIQWTGTWSASTAWRMLKERHDAR